jgi:hypothetical protein
MASSGLIRWSGLAALLGGALWVPYGIFEMLEPWGGDVVYREDVGYSVITDAPLFVTYSLPGSLAVLLTSLGLLGVVALLGASSGRTGRISLVLEYVALALAALGLAGVIVLFDPLFTGGRIFGSLALGTATLLAGVNALRSRVASGWTVALLVLGLGGVFLLPLWPLVYALMWLPEAAGAAFIALFGLGWMAVGYALWSEKSEIRSRTVWPRN